MWLYFNKQGQLITSLEHGEIARAGTTQFSIFAVFEGLDSSIPNIKAAIKLFKPDLYGSSYPVLIMDAAVKEFVLQTGEDANSVLPFKTSDSPYHGFYFDFANFNTSQDTEVLLDTDGLWTAVITLVSGDRTLNVQGVATFNVAQGIVSQDGTDIDIDTVLLQILQEVAKKLDIDSGIVVIQNTDIAPENLAEFENGQLFFSRDDKKLFELVITGEEPPYTYTLVSYSNFADLNIENGDGLYALQQIRDIESVNFTGRNPNAEALNPTLSDIFETGASGEESATFNGNTMAMAKRSMANGNKTIAKGEESHAEGYQSVTLGDGSHAEGERTTAASSVSHSEGSDTIANAYASHVEGVRSQTKSFTEGGANGSHAEGESTLASGYASHTEGYGSYAGAIENAPTYPETPDVPGGGGGGGATQVGNAAHAEGNYCRAIGTGSHAEGYRTSALHEASHTEGVGTKSSNNGQSVMGSYNADNSDAIVIVGKGTGDENRSNALEVLADGRVKIGATPTQNMDVVNKGYVDAVIAGVYKIQGSATVVDLNNLTKTATMNGYVYNMSNGGTLNQYGGGATLSVQEGDNVAFIWNEGIWYWDNMVGFIDTSNLVTLDTDQTISGLKTINDTLIISNGSAKLTIKNNGWTSTIAQEGGMGLNFTGAALVPTNNSIRDLGSSSYQWKDLYLSNSIVFSPNQTYYGKIIIESQGISLGTNVQNCLKFSGYGMYAIVSLVPNTNNGQSLGNPDNKWKNLYIQGNITDGTASFTVDSAYKILYGKTINNLPILEYESKNVITTSIGTNITLRTPKTGCLPIYEGFITNLSQSAISFGFPNSLTLLTNDEDNVSVSGSILTIGAGITIEFSLCDNKLVAINWAV